MRILLKIIAWVMLLPIFAMAQTTEPSAPPQIRRGTFHITFTQPDPRSAVDAQSARHHVGVGEMDRYDLKKESFEAYVPQDYQPDQPYGLMVWVNAGDRGGVPRGWNQLLDKHKLIFISANQSGNDRKINARFGLALDGAFNMEQLYTIDPARVYVSGISGGGKIAAMLGIIYPEVFSGTVPIVGVSYFKNIPLRDDPKRGWAATFTRPPTAMLDRARELGRFVLITGPGDMNRDSIKDTYDRGFIPDQFLHVDYVEVPGMGHSLPPTEVMDDALNKLDKPLAALAQKMLDLAQQLEKSRKPADARGLYRAVVLHGDPQQVEKANQMLARMDEPPVAIPASVPPTTRPATQPAAAAVVESRPVQAGRLLVLAQNYERARLYAQARERANAILKDFPNTPAAAEARLMLRRIDAQR